MIVQGAPAHRDEALSIIDLLPDYFLPRVRDEIDPLFLSKPWLVSLDDAGQVAGFLVWDERASETELLWMAVHPSAQGRSIGSALLSACFQCIDLSKPVFLLTATTDSKIPGTAFDGTAYEKTYQFFASRGFVRVEVRQSYWGPENHCLVMRYKPSRKKMRS